MCLCVHVCGRAGVCVCLCVRVCLWLACVIVFSRIVMDVMCVCVFSDCNGRCVYEFSDCNVRHVCVGVCLLEFVCFRFCEFVYACVFEYEMCR